MFSVPSKIINRYSTLSLFKRCLNDHKLPYPKLSKEEREALTSLSLTENLHIQLEGMPAKEFADVDPDSEPFNHIYQGVDDKGFFTKVENVTDKDPDRWFWVERLLVKKNISSYPTLTSKDNNQSKSFPSGYQPVNQIIPDLPYFIGRTRNGLYPVFKIVHFNQNVSTVVSHIEGDVWFARKQIVQHLKGKLKPENLVTVNEVHGSLSIRGDHVLDVINFLKETGF
ncbi:39S ribosomal protein L49, mitochondrial-like [Panonychus citri]|uniref:39S ribosomal protein L49, mitochondrial-like n=1 Tax=Panonychus citri TaxID=50023 RepID=UPI002307BEAA|nr:39S ribosomal protein L49, mitochondrial-like [Panonychus citri]